MYTLPNLPKTSHISVTLDQDLSVVDRLLNALRTGGVGVHRWSLASTDRPEQSRLHIDFTGKSEVVEGIVRNAELRDFDLLEGENAATVELALVTVRAEGAAQDEAAEIVAAAGGRLITLNGEGFTAQVSNRPERIDAMIQCLRHAVPVEAVRSGRLSLPRP